MLWVVLLAGCSREAERPPYVARVDESVLTEDDLAASRNSPGDVHSREFINNWVTTELLYQEAVRRGLANSVDLQRQLEAVKKQFAINALLEEELYASDTALASDAAIAAWYDSTKNAFLLKEDVVSMSYALFAERDAANAFRARLLRSIPWSSAVAVLQSDSLLRPLLLQIATRQYFTHSNLYPEELWKLSRTLAREEVSFVLKTDAGYYVLVAHGVQRTGEIPDLEYVRNEIRDRILIAERRANYEKLLKNLRSTHSVEIHIAPVDSVTPSIE